MTNQPIGNADFPLYVLIPAAGSSTRMGGVSKQLLEVSGRPVLARTLDAFERHPAVKGILLAGRTEEVITFRELAAACGISKLLDVTPGGSTRQETVRMALLHLADLLGTEEADRARVLIHDGARCLIRAATITACAEALLHERAVTAAVPAKDTIAVAQALTEPAPGAHAEGLPHIGQVPERRLVWQIQTPQGFRLRDILSWHDAAAKAGTSYTDDSAIALAQGCPVALIEADYENLKITTPDDIHLAASILAERRG